MPWTPAPEDPVSRWVRATSQLLVGTALCPCAEALWEMQAFQPAKSHRQLIHNHLHHNLLFPNSDARQNHMKHYYIQLLRNDAF